MVLSNIFFYFHPYLGKIPILTDIFQLASNHQLGKCWWLSKFNADLPSNDPFSRRGFQNIKLYEVLNSLIGKGLLTFFRKSNRPPFV